MLNIIEQMPESGKIMLAHPSTLWPGWLAAQQEGLDLMLDHYVPPGRIFKLDIDRLNDLFVTDLDGLRT